MSLELHNQILDEFKKITQLPFNPLFLCGFALEQVGFNLGLAESTVHLVIPDPYVAFVQAHGIDNVAPILSQETRNQMLLRQAEIGLSNMARAWYGDGTVAEPGKYPGYVYLFRSGDNPNTYKIGQSKNPDQRLKALNRNLPPGVPLTQVVHVIPCDTMDKPESMLHEEYQDQRIQREWFDLSGENVHKFCSIAEYKDDEFILTSD